MPDHLNQYKSCCVACELKLFPLQAMLALTKLFVLVTFTPGK